jgi:hypothetical protein
VPTRIACSCPDWRFHGGNLSRQRLENKAKLAEAVTVEPGKPGEFTAWSQEDDRHHVTLEPGGELDRLCKHCVAVLWHQNIPLYLVEYGDAPWEEASCEVRTEAFWGDELAVKAIMEDGEVTAVTKLERRKTNEG